MIVIPEEIDWTELTISVIIGYVISWAYFFLTLPIMIKFVGKITGPIVNYGISWIVWLFVTILIKKYNKDDE